MTRLSNCKTDVWINTDQLALTTSPEQRADWSTEHARCFICALPAPHTETQTAGGIAVNWHCPVHAKDDVEIDWPTFDEFMGLSWQEIGRYPIRTAVSE